MPHAPMHTHLGKALNLTEAQGKAVRSTEKLGEVLSPIQTLGKATSTTALLGMALTSTESQARPWDSPISCCRPQTRWYSEKFLSPTVTLGEPLVDPGRP